MSETPLPERVGAMVSICCLGARTCRLPWMFGDSPAVETARHRGDGSAVRADLGVAPVSLILAPGGRAQ